MNKEQYLEMRNALVAEAEGLIAESKFEDSTAKMEEVKELDNKFEGIQREMANLNALKEQTVVTLENKSVKPDEIVNSKQITALGEKEQMENKVVMENAFAKVLMGKELSQVEMENVTYAEDNQVVIPQTTMNEVIGLVSEQYPFFGNARKLEIKGNVRIPKHKAITSGDAKFYAEKTPTEVEANEMVQITLTGKEVSKLIEITFKLEAMSVDAFLAYLKQELVDRIGALVGSKVFTGDASALEPEFEGCIKVLETAGQKVSYPLTGLTYENVTEAFGKVASQFANRTAVYASNATIWNQLANITTTSGQPIFIADPTGQTVGRMFGRPVLADGGVPEGVIVIGSAQDGYVINTNKGLTLESDRNLKARTTEFLAHAIMDGAVTNEKALVVVAPTA